MYTGQLLIAYRPLFLEIQDWAVLGATTSSGIHSYLTTSEQNTSHDTTSVDSVLIMGSFLPRKPIREASRSCKVAETQCN
jgi:hypothetical protein